MSSSSQSIAANLQSAVNDETDQPTKLTWWLALAILVVAGGALSLYRWYQHEYSFTVGLDYFEPEFQTYWMSLLYSQLTIIFFAGLAIVGAIWFTRPKELDISPREELNRYMMVMTVMAGIGVIAPTGIILYMEADAAWHQVTIRDTDFTPTHIGLFYFFIPALIVALAAAFVWVHTRLPDFRDRISFPLALMVSGPILIMPNLGFNEWGHTFFYAEELFAAPIHWGFVTLGWALFSFGGFITQVLNRIARLTKTVKEESAAATA